MSAKSWRGANHHLRDKAYRVLIVATRAGLIPAPSACADCAQTVEQLSAKYRNDDGGLHAHHEDYAKPLDVVFVCPKCHRARHSVGGWAGATQQEDSRPAVEATPVAAPVPVKDERIRVTTDQFEALINDRLLDIGNEPEMREIATAWVDREYRITETAEVTPVWFWDDEVALLAAAKERAA